jgi:hypothetical protein
MVVITRVISLTNFAIATSALAFQVGVLYPWHKQLDEDFEKLRTEHLRVLQATGQQQSAESKAVVERREQRGVLDMLSGGLWKH